MPRKSINPFNVVLLVVGILFVLTACGYSVMTVRGAQPTELATGSSAGVKFLELLDEYGFTVLMVELAILALTTFAAIATDGYWSQGRNRDS